MDFELTPAQSAVQTLARDFAQGRVAPLAREMDEQGEMPLALVREMGALGLLGGPLPPEYGGQGWDPLALALCYEELGRADSSVRGFMTVHTSLVAQCLLAWGTPDQKQSYLPRLARGEWIGCYCLTEPNAGSDAASLETEAVEEAGGYRLRGEKIWITNGGIAQLGIVFATRDRAARHRGVCAFLVEMDTPGVRREKMPGRELGHRASDHAQVHLDGLRLPASALLGAAGEDFEMIQATLADMAADVEAARLLVHRAGWLQAQGRPATRETSIAKLFATEAAARAASEAVLLHGGRGYSNEYPVERYYRDIKGLQIYEGTSHIQRIVIARELIGKEAPKA